jgi:hypothetical protein
MKYALAMIETLSQVTYNVAFPEDLAYDEKTIAAFHERGDDFFHPTASKRWTCHEKQQTKFPIKCVTL